MDEAEAKLWVESNFGAEGLRASEVIVDLVVGEAARQNLVSPSTLNTIWNRHIVDSAQLLALADPLHDNHLWMDVGSGAGFPGLVVAALSPCRAILVEPRKLRAVFLRTAIDELGIACRAEVICGKIQAVEVRADIISARAVGHLNDMLGWAARCADARTQWIFPKGRSASDEIAYAKTMWHGTFHVEQSITDPDSSIVLASGIARR